MTDIIDPGVTGLFRQSQEKATVKPVEPDRAPKIGQTPETEANPKDVGVQGEKLPRTSPAKPVSRTKATGARNGKKGLAAKTAPSFLKRASTDRVASAHRH